MYTVSQCANCERAIDAPEQKFCPACGQPTPVHRIDWHFLGHEFEHSVLHMDRGILYTLKNLLLRPGHFIRDYIEGRRANHVKPLLLIMLMAAVIVFLSKLMFGGDIIGSALSVGYSKSEKPDAAAIANALNAMKEWVNRHYAATTLLLLPVEAAAFKLSFMRFKKTYPEWLVITAFLTAQAFLIHAAFILLDRWLPGRQQWSAVVIFVYLVFSLTQYFDEYPRWKAVLRAILGFLFFQIVAVIFGAVVAVFALVGAAHA